MEALHKVAESKDEAALLSQLERIGKPTVKNGVATDLGKSKSTAPATGFAEVKEPEEKRQKTEEAATFDWKGGFGGGDEPEECLNCGS